MNKLAHVIAITLTNSQAIMPSRSFKVDGDTILIYVNSSLVENVSIAEDDTIQTQMSSVINRLMCTGHPRIIDVDFDNIINTVVDCMALTGDAECNITHHFVKCINSHFASVAAVSPSPSELYVHPVGMSNCDESVVLHMDCNNPDFIEEIKATITALSVPFPQFSTSHAHNLILDYVKTRITVNRFLQDANRVESIGQELFDIIEAIHTNDAYKEYAFSVEDNLVKLFHRSELLVSTPTDRALNVIKAVLADVIDFDQILSDDGISVYGRDLKPGVYRFHWKSSGSSVGVVFIDRVGNRGIVCSNWTCKVGGTSHMTAPVDEIVDDLKSFDLIETQ